MNIDTVYLTDDHETAYTPDELSNVLFAIVPGEALLNLAALRLAGFDRVSAACATLQGIEGAPDSLGRIVEHLETERADEFKSLAEKVIEAIGMPALRGEWKRLRAAIVTAGRPFPALDTVMIFANRLQTVAADGFLKIRRETQAKRFKELRAIKRDGISDVKRVAAMNGSSVEYGRDNGLRFIPQ